MGLLQQEGPERAALWIETLGFVPQAEKDLLHDLLGEAGIPEHPLGQPEHRPPAWTAEHLRQGIVVPTADGDHEGRRRWPLVSLRSAGHPTFGCS